MIFDWNTVIGSMINHAEFEKNYLRRFWTFFHHISCFLQYYDAFVFILDTHLVNMLILSLNDFFPKVLLARNEHHGIAMDINGGPLGMSWPSVNCSGCVHGISTDVNTVWLKYTFTENPPNKQILLICSLDYPRGLQHQFTPHTNTKKYITMKHPQQKLPQLWCQASRVCVLISFPKRIKYDLQ